MHFTSLAPSAFYTFLAPFASALAFSILPFASHCLKTVAIQSSWLAARSSLMGPFHPLTSCASLVFRHSAVLPFYRSALYFFHLILHPPLGYCFSATDCPLITASSAALKSLPVSGVLLDGRESSIRPLYTSFRFLSKT